MFTTMGTFCLFRFVSFRLISLDFMIFVRNLSLFFGGTAVRVGETVIDVAASHRIPLSYRLLFNISLLLRAEPRAYKYTV